MENPIWKSVTTTSARRRALKSYKTEKDILNPRSERRIPITGILTPKRFVALWRVKIGYPAGPLVWLVQWLFKRKNIAFSLPLHTLSKIIDGPGFTLTAAGRLMLAHSMSVDAAFSTDAKNKEMGESCSRKPFLRHAREKGPIAASRRSNSKTPSRTTHVHASAVPDALLTCISSSASMSSEMPFAFAGLRADRIEILACPVGLGDAEPLKAISRARIHEPVRAVEGQRRIPGGALQLLAGDAP